MSDVLIDRVACRKVCAVCPNRFKILDIGLLEQPERNRRNRRAECVHLLSRFTVARAKDRGDEGLDPDYIDEATSPTGGNHKKSSTSIYPDTKGSIVGVPSDSYPDATGQIAGLEGFNTIRLTEPEAVGERHFL